MSATKDWSALVPPTSTQYWADGEAAEYTVHTPPPWAKRVTAINSGAGLGYVAKPALTGTSAGVATDNKVPLDPNAAGAGRSGGSVTLSLVDKRGNAPADRNNATLPRTFSTFGADGATHKWHFNFDEVVGGS